ncbi:hypothetical protein BaRGS_00022142 [Batillaria attramentaria]|uniref:Uncharacterized protein n=1 Tax=Batillaria attramentaria TaxID=370345 RepID=A0ABD0KHU6_9CAEN
MPRRPAQDLTSPTDNHSIQKIASSENIFMQRGRTTLQADASAYFQFPSYKLGARTPLIKRSARPTNQSTDRSLAPNPITHTNTALHVEQQLHVRCKQASAH